jgi:hypothetical protein
MVAHTGGVVIPISASPRATAETEGISPGTSSIFTFFSSGFSIPNSIVSHEKNNPNQGTGSARILRVKSSVFINKLPVFVKVEANFWFLI